MSKTKILVLTSSYPSNDMDSSGLFVEEISKRLTNVLEVFVLTPYSKEALIEEYRNGIKIFRYKYWPGGKLFSDGEIMNNLKRNKLFFFQILPFLVSQLIGIYKIIEKEKIPIIHAHWLIPQGFLAVIYKNIFNGKVKIITTIHGADINSFDNLIGRKITRYTLKRIDKLTVVSNAIKEKAIDLGYKENVYVYPMGVDTKLFTPEKKDKTIKIKHEINGSFLLFVGGLTERKGIRYLIQAMPAVLEEFPDVKLLVIGDGNLKEEMSVLSTKLKVSHNIIFTGSIPHDDLPPYFATADLFILPSFSEGWPVVVMEALSSGTKTIVSNIPVFEKHEQKEQLFSIVPVGNSKAISDVVVKILSQDAISLNNEYLRFYAQKELDWRVISDKFWKLIINALKLKQ